MEHLLAEESTQKDEHDQFVASDMTCALHALQHTRPSIICENTVCKAAGQTGHLIADCFWPGGGKEEQWLNWWQNRKGGELTLATSLSATVA
jgi:hypothetical protein